MNNSIQNSLTDLNTATFSKLDIAKTVEKLTSFSSGQGNTVTLPEKFEISVTDDGRLKLTYLGSFSLTFQDNAHMLSFLVMLAAKEFSSKTADSLPKWCEHLSKGYLSLNHNDGKSIKTTVSLWYKLTPYHDIFKIYGITDAQSNGKGSKMTRLLCNPTQDTVKALIDAGFSNISPIVDGLTIIGLKCELPSDIA